MDLRRIEDVPVLMSALRRWARARPVARNDLRRFELALAELASNAVVHGGRGRCELLALPARIIAVVTDEGRRPVGVGAGLGEGLGVVARQADGWDVELLERGGRRVSVWIETGVRR